MSNIVALGTWMAGDFSNWEQAIANPPLFAHIRVGIRPLPVPCSDLGIWLYLEQAYDYELEHPYRTAVLQLVDSNDAAYPIYIENYRPKDAPAYFGASREPERLRSLNLDQLDHLPGCKMLVQQVGNSFKGIVQEGKGCAVVRKGRETYLKNEFEVGENYLNSLDRGYDLTTDELVWGTIAGAFEFVKKTSFWQV